MTIYPGVCPITPDVQSITDFTIEILPILIERFELVESSKTSNDKTQREIDCSVDKQESMARNGTNRQYLQCA